MDLGICMFATDYSIRTDELARAAEERGFESLFVPEHTHIPTSRRTPFPGRRALPKEYSHTFDPFISLMAAAAATKRLKIGTGICLIIERDTITTAKEVASLDQLSGGRFLFGIGAGWNADEMEKPSTTSAASRAAMASRIAPPRGTPEMGRPGPEMPRRTRLASATTATIATSAVMATAHARARVGPAPPLSPGRRGSSDRCSRPARSTTALPPAGRAPGTRR